MNPFDSYTPRAGERRLGDLLRNRPAGEGRYIIVGAPEDIGVRANLGRMGAAETPGAVFQSLAAMPCYEGVESMDLGWAWVDVADLQAQSLQHSGTRGPERLAGTRRRGRCARRSRPHALDCPRKGPHTHRGRPQQCLPLAPIPRGHAWTRSCPEF